jgi:exodeoxyribonuclease V gamma subunit
MLHICYSNRLEVLLAPLMAQVDEVQRKHPLQAITIVTPNRAVEQYISLAMANQLGIAGNLSFYRLGGFLRDVLKRDVPDFEVLDNTSMQLMLFDQLSDPSALQHPDFASLNAYFAGCAPGIEWTLRALQLSGELARLFEEYTFSRPEMLSAWLNPNHPEPTHVIERWQRHLYRRVCTHSNKTPGTASSQLGLFETSEQTTAPDTHRLLFPNLFEVLDQAEWPESLFVFGLSYVAPSFVRLFDRLSELTDIHLYTLNPCFEYWEDAHKKTLKQLKSEHHVFAEPPATYAFDEEESPALTLWGKPGREYLKKLNEMSHALVTGGFIDPTEDTDSLLLQIQHDILMRQSPRPYTLNDDESVVLIRSADRRSEVEAVALQIHALLEKDTSLGLRDVAVLICEDHKNEYLAHIEAVFWQAHKMPYNTVDRSLQSSSQVVEHVRQLLNLCTERFQMRTLIALMENQLSWPEDSETSALVPRWCEQLRPSYLLKNQPGNDYFGEEAHDLTTAIEHFLAQALCGGDTPPECLENMHLNEPFISLSEMPQSLEFYARINAIIEAVTDFKAAQRTLEEWHGVIDKYICEHTFAITGVDEYSFEQCRTALKSLAQADVVGRALPFAAVHALLMPRLDGLTGGIGQLLASGVIVSSLLPMRILPAKVMILMGLGTGGFPGTSHINPLDLRQRDRRSSDVYAGERDRYLFLESLLSVRQHFVCTFVGVHPTTGESESPSPIVEELLFILERYIGESGVKTIEKAYSALAWNADGDTAITQTELSSTLRSVRHATLGGAAIPSALLAGVEPLNHPDIVVPKIQSESKASKPLTSINVRQIKAFLKSPLQASARVKLGLYDQALAQLEDDREPLEADGFDLGQLATNCFWKSPTLDEAVTHFELGLKILQSHGKLPFGVFFDQVKQQGIDWLEIWWNNAALVDLGCPTQYQSVRLGDGRPGQATTHRFAPLLIDGMCSKGEPTMISIEGDLERVHQDGHTIARIMKTQRIGRKYFLDPFITSVCLAGIGQPPSDPARLIVLPTKQFAQERLCQSIKLPSPDQATDYLSHIAAELTGRFHDYRLSIEAVFKFVNATESSSTAVFRPLTVTETSDQYGPIRTPDQFEAPSPEAVMDMIDQRFGPWFNAERR